MEKVSIPMEELYRLLCLQLERGSASLTVTGNSMYPTLRDRLDSVTLTRPESPPGKHDLILFRRDSGEYILHRIVKVTPEGYLCCGDNQWETEPVQPDQVLALVTHIVRSGRFFHSGDPRYQRWVRIWTALLPVRKPIILLRERAGRLKRKWMRTHQKRESL